MQGVSHLRNLSYYTLRHKPGNKFIEYVYNISFEFGCIIVNGKKLKIKENREFCFKLQKTQVQAKNGTDGLRDFIKEHLQGFGELWVYTICKHVVEFGKAA